MLDEDEEDIWKKDLQISPLEQIFAIITVLMIIGFVVYGLVCILI